MREKLAAQKDVAFKKALAGEDANPSEPIRLDNFANALAEVKPGQQVEAPPNVNPPKSAVGNEGADIFTNPEKATGKAGPMKAQDLQTGIERVLGKLETSAAGPDTVRFGEGKGKAGSGVNDEPIIQIG